MTESKRRPFFLEITMISDEISSLSENLRQFFCPIRKVLENHDSGKRHKIWEKLHCPQIFWAGTPLKVGLLENYDSGKYHFGQNFLSPQNFFGWYVYASMYKHTNSITSLIGYRTPLYLSI